MPRKPEQVLWDDLSKVMDGHWEADRIENSVGRNIPDLYFRFGGKGAFCGWIELKQIFKWNYQRNQPTKVSNFTAGQKGWLARHHRSGANCWLLLHVRLTNEYIFLPGSKAGIVGDVSQSEIYINCYEHFRGLPTAATIRTILESRGEE